MKTVLLAWELGGGAGHATLLGRLAKRLARHDDIRLIAAVKTPTSFEPFQGTAEVIQAPPWPSAAPSSPRTWRSSASLGDILSAAGLSDAAGLSRLLDWWEALFSRCAPDLVIGVFAPAAALAARGRLPVVLVGNGYSLPPCDVDTFPPLHNVEPPGNEAETVDVLNGMLRSRGMRSVDRLPQIFAADARMVFSFPLLDPYAAYRTEEVHGPSLDYDPVAADPGTRTVFVYLARGYRLHRDLPTCLLRHAKSLRIHAPNLSASEASILADAGARIEKAPVAPAIALSDAALVVHFGGALLASETLLAGVPQLVLSMHIEQWLTGAALEAAGIGRVLAAYDPGDLAFDLAALKDDAALRAAAAEAGERHRALFKSAPDPLTTLEHTCRAFLDGGTGGTC